jgi:hypothetical protein
MPLLNPQTPVEYAFAVGYIARGSFGKKNKYEIITAPTHAA